MIKLVYVNIFLIMILLCSCGKNNTHKEESLKLQKTIITKVELEIWIEKNKSFKKVIDNQEINKYKNAIIDDSKPYLLNGGDANIRLSLAAYGQVIFLSNGDKIIVDICGTMFFWNPERTLKHAFISKKLAELIIKDLEGVDDVKGIVSELQKQTR